MPRVALQFPPSDFLVPAGQQLRVAGLATGKGGAEPVGITEVTASVDGGAAVNASLTFVAHQHVPTVRFTATVTVPDAPGTHTVTVVAHDDISLTATASVEVLRGVSTVVPPPAILIDLEPPFATAADDASVQALVSSVAQGLSAQAAALSAAGLLLAGPNVLATQDGAGTPILRLGIWLLDQGFPVEAPAPPQRPLPRLSDIQAEVGFAQVAPLSRGHRKGVTDVPFGLRVPVTTMQRLIDVAVARAGRPEVTSVAVAATAPATVTTAVHGSRLGIGFEIDVIETLSTVPVIGAVPAQSVPHVDLHHTSSVGGALDWLLGTLFPILDGLLLIADLELDDAAGEVPGVVSALVANLPARVPFRNTSLPPVAARLFDFPQVVLNWTSFGVDDDAVLGSGDAVLAERDQAGAGLSVRGPDSLRIPAGEFDIDLAYRIDLTGIRPDSDRVAWRLTHPTGAATNGTVGTDTFADGADLDLDFALPLHTHSGTFTVTASAVETCGTEPSKTLSASATATVHVTSPAHAPI